MYRENLNDSGAKTDRETLCGDKCIVNPLRTLICFSTSSKYSKSKTKSNIIVKRKYWSLFSSLKITLKWVLDIKSNHFTPHPLNHYKQKHYKLMKPITNFYQIKARSWQISTFQRPQKQMIVLNRVSKEPNPLCAADSSSSLMASLCFSLSLSLSICPFMIPSARTQLRKYLQLRAPHQPTSANITARVRYPDKCLMPSVLHSQQPVVWGLCVVREKYFLWHQQSYNKWNMIVFRLCNCYAMITWHDAMHPKILEETSE